MKTGAENGKGTTTKCPICGKNFRRKHANQIFCNRSCSAKGRNGWTDADGTRKPQKRQIRKKRYCTVCGAELREDQGPTAKYCGDACKKIGIADRKRASAEALREHGRMCVVCGKRFKPQNAMTKICSEECQMKAKKECLIRIRKAGANLRQDMQPKVGAVYKATRCLCLVGNSKFYIVPGFGKYGVIIREDEAEEITTA